MLEAPIPADEERRIRYGSMRELGAREHIAERRLGLKY
jgi:hypothetical protein